VHTPRESKLGPSNEVDCIQGGRLKATIQRPPSKSRSIRCHWGYPKGMCRQRSHVHRRSLARILRRYRNCLAAKNSSHTRGHARISNHAITHQIQCINIRGLPVISWTEYGNIAEICIDTLPAAKNSNHIRGPVRFSIDAISHWIHHTLIYGCLAKTFNRMWLYCWNISMATCCFFLSLGWNPAGPTYSSIPGNRNWQIETADWNLDVRLDIW